MASPVTGERIVITLFVARLVAFALSSSLLPHALALSLLSLAAFFIEVRADSPHSSLSLSKTRPGASSGVLLGAVTLPALMLSKLIQMSRAVSVKEIEIEEFEHLTMQYWAASACCLGVLVLLCVAIQRSRETKQAFISDWNVKFSFACILLCLVLCGVSLGSISLTGVNTALKLLWMLFHGLAAVKLIQHLLITFPSCASIGEALLVTSGLVLYFSDMLALTIAKASRLLIKEEMVRYGSKRTEIGIIVQGMVLGLLLLPSIFNFVLRTWKWSITRAHSESRSDSKIQRSLIFFSALGFIMIVIAPAWMQFVQDFQMHPLLWVLSFVFSEPLKRLSLCFYWVSVISVLIVRFYKISKSSKTERILLRKYYHVMAVAMFLPALIYQPKFLDLAFGAALGVFMALEIIRVWRIWPLGQHVHQFMTAFTDHRDSDILIVSHFSLLLGCALPIWMSSGFNDRPLAPFAGILSLGIGDTMASWVGYKYGVLRWSKAGKKTIEGTAAGITSVLAVCSILLPFLAFTGYIVTERWISVMIAVTVSGLLEAYTAQLDNAFLPLVFYALICL